MEDAVDALAMFGPTLGRPLVDRIKGAEQHHMKELRPGSSGGSEVRILFAFDPVRRAVLLVAGDKAGNWQGWYEANVPLAEKRYRSHIAELDTREYESALSVGRRPSARCASAGRRQACPYGPPRRSRRPWTGSRPRSGRTGWPRSARSSP
ncbi:type II toxin-antitoxin system RelE/ParE family toxin [Streptomyces lavendulae]|uniref:type II toxin-antitoxin system RelE/ParE family toxin n=1 Tax=Streptomyces lavendulae TaxID=1914 RepID=UPI003D9DB899